MNMYGKGFAADGMSCRFGGEVVSTATFVSSTAAACTAPAWMSTGVVTVEVSLNDGADFSDVGAEFTYETGATVETVLPTRGGYGIEGQTVTVMGKHFQATGNWRCHFSKKDVEGLLLSSTAVVCNAPPRGAGAVSVSVSNGGLVAQGAALYEYGARRAALSFHPSKGPNEGGTLVTVTGIESGAESVECQFGVDLWRLGTVVSGTVVCSTPSSNAAGLVNFVLRNRSEGTVDGDVFKYEYYAMPTISGVFPGVGLVRGGSVVSVRGTGFITEEGLACRFGGLVVSGTGARLETSTVVACIAPKPREEGAVAVEMAARLFSPS